MSILSLTNLYPKNFFNDDTINKSLGEEFYFCENGNMIFHWADFNETCEIIKNHLECDISLKEELHKKDETLSRLKLIPIWLRTKTKVYQFTMFELYERFILNEIHVLGDIDPHELLEISFISATGPFKHMGITECFGPHTYRDFILVYLLNGKLPKRNFRIRLKSKVLAEYGKDFAKARLIGLEQMTATGLLLSVDDEFYNNELLTEDSIRLIIDTKVLREAIGKDIKDLKTHLSAHTFNLLYSSRKEDAMECLMQEFTIQSSFDFNRNRKVFMFISYDKLGGSAPHSIKVIRDFIHYARDLVRNYYKDLSESVKSA